MPRGVHGSLICKTAFADSGLTFDQEQAAMAGSHFSDGHPKNPHLMFAAEIQTFYAASRDGTTGLAFLDCIAVHLR
jgi:hypothetical protein